MELLIAWLVYALAIAISAYLLPGVTLSGFGAALIVAVVLGLINAFIKPLLVLLTLPVNILTLGLFIFVINAVLILATSAFVPGFKVDGFWWALLFSFILAIVSAILFSLVDEAA